MDRRMFIAMASGLVGVRLVGSSSWVGASSKACVADAEARVSRAEALRSPADLRQGGAGERVFTLEEVKSLNAFQRSGVAHPYTCVRGRNLDHLDGEGVLLATERGWVCLYCDYTQQTAHGFMRNWKWKERFAQELEAMRR